MEAWWQRAVWKIYWATSSFFRSEMREEDIKNAVAQHLVIYCTSLILHLAIYIFYAIGIPKRTTTKINMIDIHAPSVQQIEECGYISIKTDQAWKSKRHILIQAPSSRVTTLVERTCKALWRFVVREPISPVGTNITYHTIEVESIGAWNSAGKDPRGAPARSREYRSRGRSVKI